MTAGANMVQHRYQNMDGLCPVICWMQSQNLPAPKNHPMAMVWKKQTHSRERPEAE